jgi:hypothetical protein
MARASWFRSAGFDFLLDRLGMVIVGHNPQQFAAPQAEEGRPISIGPEPMTPERETHLRHLYESLRDLTDGQIGWLETVVEQFHKPPQFPAFRRF